MTKDEIINMAREAGFETEDWANGTHVIVYESGREIDITNELERFAALVAAHERDKQAAQEPVAWMRLNDKGKCEAIEYIRNFDEHLYLPPSCQWLYTIPVQYKNTEPKVIAYIVARPDSISRKLVWVENMDAYKLEGDIVTPLYAAPVQQVDLTGNEINRVWESVTNLPITTRETTFARAVIHEFRRKNK